MNAHTLSSEVNVRRSIHRLFHSSRRTSIVNRTLLHKRNDVRLVRTKVQKSESNLTQRQQRAAADQMDRHFILQFTAKHNKHFSVILRWKI